MFNITLVSSYHLWISFDLQVQQYLTDTCVVDIANSIFWLLVLASLCFSFIQSSGRIGVRYFASLPYYTMKLTPNAKAHVAQHM